MAVKSIIDVDVNTAAFNNFNALFLKYQAALTQTQGTWGHITSQMQQQTKGFTALTQAIVSQNQQIQQANTTQANITNQSTRTAQQWSNIAQSARNFSVHIGNATLSLLKWSTLTAGVSGLLGAGGLFGIDRLAYAGAAGSRSALGRGTSFGSQTAFEAAFSRFGDGSSFLDAVANAKLDLTKRTGLKAIGLSNEEIDADTSSTAAALLGRLKHLSDTTSSRQYAQTLGAFRLDQFATPQFTQLLRGIKPSEFAQFNQQFSGNRSRFDLTENEQKSLRDVTTTLTTAWADIEVGFLKRVSQMAPTLEHLSVSFEKLARSILDSPTLAKWITDVDKAMEVFADYIGTPAFRQNIESFVTGVGQLASAIGGFLGRLGFGGGGDSAGGSATGEGSYTSLVTRYPVTNSWEYGGRRIFAGSMIGSDVVPPGLESVPIPPIKPFSNYRGRTGSLESDTDFSGRFGAGGGSVSASLMDAIKPYLERGAGPKEMTHTVKVAPTNEYWTNKKMVLYIDNQAGANVFTSVNGLKN